MAGARIAVLYPRGQKTGGPEAAHQLVHELRDLGHEAYLCPHPDTADAPRVPEFGAYDCPELPLAQVEAHDTFVTAEVYVKELLQSRARDKVLWWLSADNCSALIYTMMRNDPLRSLPGGMAGFPRNAWRLTREAYLRRRLRSDDTVRRLAQSEYARGVVRDVIRKPARMLSDYTVGVVPTVLPDRHPGRIAYNPAKGGEIVAGLSSRLRDLEFQPITRMSPVQVAEALASSSVYLDLGHHPGKDRIPREARLLGSVVVVALRGSAAVEADVPLPDRFKIPTDGDVVENAAAVLRDVLNDLEGSRAAQEAYTSEIRAERAVFTAEVQRAFGGTGD